MKQRFMLNAFRVIVFTSLATLVACTPEKSQPNSAKKEVETKPEAKVIISANDNRQYDTFTLPNQLEVMLISDPTAEKSAAALSVSVGLLHDPMSQQGMAHYLEHMLFLGTERFPDSAGYTDFMTANGGLHNAYTWLDITNYMFKVNNDAYAEALDRFSDFFKAPKLYPEYTEKEKNAVNAEWSMRREMDFFGQFKLARNLMGDHPANRFLIGNLETLGDKENSKLHTETVKFYEQYYSANIMKVAMISNRPLDEMKTLATQYFGTITNKDIDDPTVNNTLDFASIGKKRIHYVPNEDVKQLKLDFTITNNSDRYAYKPNRFLSYLIGSEMPGTPAYLLKEKGLISNLAAFVSPELYGNYGAFNIDIDLTDSGMQNREAIVAVVMQYINLIREQGVDAKYFDEIKTSLSNQFRFLEKSDEFGYVSNLSAAMQNVPAKYAISSPFYYESFNAQSIEDVLAQLTPEQLRVWYISKDEPSDSQLHFYDGEYQVATINDEEIATWQQAPSMALSLPAVNNLLPENFDIKTNVARSKPELVIDNDNVKVWHYPSQAFTDQPRGEIEIYINNGKAETDIRADVLTTIWQDLYRLQQSALMTEASIAGMTLDIDEGNGLILALSGFTDKQPELMKRALSALKVSVNKQNFAQAVDRYVRGLQNQGKQFPFRQAFSAYNRIIRKGNFNPEALITTAQSLKPADLAKYMEELLSEHQLRIFAFGNYGIDDLNETVKQVSSVLPENRTSIAYDYREFWQPQPGEKWVWQQDIDVADVAIVDVAVHPDSGFDAQAQGSILREHFSTAAFDKLRTEEQLAYAVGGTAVQIGDYTGFAMYIQTPVKDVESMQARFDTFKLEYRELLSNMTEETFAKLKASTLLALNEPPKNLQDEESPLISDWYKQNFNFDSKAKLIGATEKVSLDDLKEFYAKTMMNTDAARLSVQLRGTKFADKPFAEIEGATKIDDLAVFQAKMETQGK
jgi:protease-3